MPRRERALRALVTAEHGGNRVPGAYDGLFRDHRELLESHRGWDPGTAALARTLADALEAQCLVATVTRLLVDLNRSDHNPTVFSEITWPLPPEVRDLLVETYHRPHRLGVARLVGSAVEAGEDVLHLGVHSFTPVLRGQERRADLALLYDPARPGERLLAGRWVHALREALPGLRIRRNYPYRGTSDGLTTTLRRRFPDPRYLGIEIEVNQKLLQADGVFPVRIGRALLETLPRDPERPATDDGA